MKETNQTLVASFKQVTVKRVITKLIAKLVLFKQIAKPVLFRQIAAFKAVLLVCTCLFPLLAHSNTGKAYLDNDHIVDSVKVIGQKGVCFQLSETNKKVCKYDVDDELAELGGEIYVQYKAPHIVAIYQYCCGSNIAPTVTYYAYNEQQNDLVEFAFVMGASSREMIAADFTLDTSTIEIDYTAVDAMDKVDSVTQHLQTLVKGNVKRNKNQNGIVDTSLDYFDVLMLLNRHPITTDNIQQYLATANYFIQIGRTVEAILISNELLAFDVNLHQAIRLKADVYFSSQREGLAAKMYQEYITALNTAGRSADIPAYVQERLSHMKQ